MINRIVFKSKIEACNVLDNLVKAIKYYGQATVTDFYDSIGEESTYSDTKVGWNNLGSATVSYTPDGWIINFPKTIPLK